MISRLRFSRRQTLVGGLALAAMGTGTAYVGSSDANDFFRAMVHHELPGVKVNDATIREIGVLVVKALLTDDRQIVRIVEDAPRESNHIFRRDRELVLRKKVVKYLPELIGSGLSVGAIKREIEKRSNSGRKLQQYQWNRLRRRFVWENYPLDGLESQARNAKNCVLV